MALVLREPGTCWVSCYHPRFQAFSPPFAKKAPGREAGTVGGYWDLERRERTAAACIPGLLFGRTKYVESPHKLRTPVARQGF